MPNTAPSTPRNPAPDLMGVLRHEQARAETAAADLRVAVEAKAARRREAT